MESVGARLTTTDVVEGREEQAVHQTARDYVESWYAADAARMERALHPELAKCFFRVFPSGTRFLEEVGASKLVQWTASGGGQSIPTQHRHREAVVLDVYFRAAMAKVVTATGVEYLQLGRFGTDWKIINILGEARTGGPFALPLFSSHPERAQAALASDPRVEEAGRDYGEAWYTADQPRVERVIHPQWSKKCVQVTQAGGFFLESWGAEKMSRWTASAEHHADRQGLGLEEVGVSVLDQEREIAVVKVAWDIDWKGKWAAWIIFRWPKRTTGGGRSAFFWQDDRSHGDGVINEADAAGWIL